MNITCTITHGNSFTNSITDTFTITITSTNTNTYTNHPLIEMQSDRRFAKNHCLKSLIISRGYLDFIQLKNP